MGIIDKKGGIDRENKGIRDMDIDVCVMDISKEGDDADRGIRGDV